MIELRDKLTKPLGTVFLREIFIATANLRIGPH